MNILLYASNADCPIFPDPSKFCYARITPRIDTNVVCIQDEKRAKRISFMIDNDNEFNMQCGFYTTKKEIIDTVISNDNNITNKERLS